MGGQSSVNCYANTHIQQYLPAGADDSWLFLFHPSDEKAVEFTLNNKETVPKGTVSLKLYLLGRELTPTPKKAAQSRTVFFIFIFESMQLWDILEVL